MSEARGGGGARTRLSIAKAYKMYVGGAFVRSESGRYYQVRSVRTDGMSAQGTDRAGGQGAPHEADAGVVNIPLGSRKDARDAVLAARNAQDGWAARTPFNRGQILYRLAEVMESRFDELRGSLVRAGAEAAGATAEVEAAIDRAVWYAGLTDKVSALVASHNPVAGPHFGFTLPEPTGVVAIVAPERPVLLGLVSTILPAILPGNTVVAVAPENDPRTAVVFCECLATSDLPGGVVNVLTGRAAEIAPHLAKHREVAGLDVWTADATLRADLARDGAGSVKRVALHDAADAAALSTEVGGQGLGFVERFLELKTVWHPVGV
jgi:acyl-CoA reductase-like NAD-dependent aldehyde dehydrogenase